MNDVSANATVSGQMEMLTAGGGKIGVRYLLDATAAAIVRERMATPIGDDIPLEIVVYEQSTMGTEPRETRARVWFIRPSFIGALRFVPEP